MGTVSSAGRAHRRFSAGVGLVLAGGWTAALAFYASLLPWKFGVWPHTEPMVIALHAGAALCGLGLWVCARARTRLVAGIVGHPAILAALFVAVWTVLAAPFVRYPMLSLLGSPQLGEGALYYAEIAIFLAAGILLRRLPTPRRLFVWSGAVVCAVTPLIVWTAGVFEWGAAGRLFTFDDYLAWYAIAGAALVLGLADLRLSRRVAAAALVAVPGLLVSNNLTAFAVTLVVALPVAIAVHIHLVRAEPARLPVRALLAFAVPALAGAGALAVWIVGEAGAVASLTSRLFMYRALLPEVSENPAVLAVGEGWGQINTVVLAHLAQTGATIWDGSWDLSTRDIPHSHNFAIEALSGAGLPAMLGVLALLAAIVATARRRDLPAAAFAIIAMAGLGAMWFQLAATAGLVALALGGLAGPHHAWPRHVRVPPGVAIAVLPVVIALQIAALAWLLAYGVAAQRAVSTGYRAPGNSACGAFPVDTMRGSAGLTQQFGEEFLRFLETSVDDPARPSERRERLVCLYCAVSEVAADGGSLRLLLADQIFRAQLSADPGLQAGTHRFGAALSGWEAALKRFLALAPGRTDVAAPYLAWRLAQGEPQKTVVFARFLLSVNADDPVGHWFLGAGLAAADGAGVASTRDETVRHMRRALDLGVTRYIKVDPAVVRLLETQ